MATRRSFLAAGSTMLLGAELQAQGNRPAWAGKLSPAVLRGVYLAGLKIQNTPHAKLTGGDFHTLATAAGIMIDHLNEIGATPAIELVVRTSPALAVPPSVELMEKFRTAWGTSITDQQFQSAISKLQVNWSSLRQNLSEGVTLHSLLLTAPQSMHKAAAALDKQQGLANLPGGHTLEAQNWICAFLDAIGGYTAVWSYMAAIDSAPELALIMADPIVAAVLAAFGLFGWAFSEIFC